MFVNIIIYKHFNCSCFKASLKNIQTDFNNENNCCTCGMFSKTFAFGYRQSNVVQYFDLTPYEFSRQLNIPIHLPYYSNRHWQQTDVLKSSHRTKYALERNKLTYVYAATNHQYLEESIMIQSERISENCECEVHFGVKVLMEQDFLSRCRFTYLYSTVDTR